jgi:uncharacterized surface protein with fasciclin (FAS1) repeats
MKKNKLFLGVLGMALTTMTILSGCGGSTGTETTTEATTEEAMAVAGQSAVKDDESQKDVVKVAIGSKDHTTLVAAVQAAELVDVLSNAGPFTVFAPTNDAFNLLPAGTVDDLLKPENKEKLHDILQYHVAVAVYKPEMMRDGQVIGMANSGNITISVKDGKTMLNGKATILASVNASNGIIHVIDQVLLEEKK